MQIPDNNRFCIYGVGAIIEHVNNEEERFVLIQNRIKKGKQSGLIEIPCGKVQALENMCDVLRKRVNEETGLEITKIYGVEECITMKKSVQSCQPFYSCQNIESDFPVAINFFVCTVEGMPKKQTDAADNIRWVAINELSDMLDNEEEKFFPVIVDALKKYIKSIEGRDRNGIYE